MTKQSIRSEVTAWSLPEQQRAAALATRPLLVMMHGFGANERDLAPLGTLLPSQFVVASIRGVMSLTQGGYAWQLMGAQDHPRVEDFSEPADAIAEWLDGVRERYGAAGTSVSLLGFSQGAAMAIQLMRQDPRRFAAGVVLSGFAGRFSLPTDGDLATVRPPLFWGRDLTDPVVLPTSIAFAEDFLPSHFTLTEHRYRGIGHSISHDEVHDVSVFLRLTLGL